MAAIISGVLTAVNRGIGIGFAQAWAFSDAVAILVAFPTAVVLLRRVRRFVEREFPGGR